MRNRLAHEALDLRFDRLSGAGHAALAFALAALWLLGRRYGGIIHDASLYVVQGLRVLDPDAYARELFFMHGAQDTYTVFPRIEALLIGAFGAGNAALMITLAGQAAFIAAAAALVFRVCAGPARWWSLALLAAVSGYYGGGGVFRIAEPFATARTLAEPLVVAGLACTLASRHAAAIALIALAGLLHPLVAVPGLAAVFIWHAMARPRLFWLIPVFAGSVVAVAAMWPGIALRFDAPWLAVVLWRSPHLFLAQWQLPDWSRFLWGFCVTGIASRYLGAPVRRLVFAVAATALAGVAASGIGVDLLHNAFAAGLQMWRAHWLLHLLGIVLVPVALAGLWRSGALAARAAAACVAASLCFGRAELPAAALLAVLAVILAASERRWPGWMGKVIFKLLLLAVLGTASVGLMFEIQSGLPLVYGAIRSPPWADYLRAATSVGGLLPLAALLWLAAYSRFAYPALGIAVAAFAVSMVAWDARVPYARFVEQANVQANPFRDAIRPGAVVFWPGSYARVWLALGTPTWFSLDQGAGIVFSRATAIEYHRRKLASHALRTAIDYCARVPPANCHIDARSVRALCEQPNGPDYAVLNAAIEGRPAIAWPLPPEIGPGRQSLFLYACRDLAGNEKDRP